MYILKKTFYFFILVFMLTLNLLTNSSAQSCLNNYNYYLTIGSTDRETNGEVSRLQAFLYSEGFLSVLPTGYFGDLTRTAVSKYQISMKITPYGTVGPITRTALSLSCNVNQSTVNNAQHFALIDTDLGCIESNYDYRIGSQDNVLFGPIMKLQTYLYQNSLMSYPPTGYFGNLTQGGLLKYQNLRRLPTTGVYDYPTRLTISKETCGGKSNLVPSINYNYTNQNPQSSN